MHLVHLPSFPSKIRVYPYKLYIYVSSDRKGNVNMKDRPLLQNTSKQTSRQADKQESTATGCQKCSATHSQPCCTNSAVNVFPSSHNGVKRLFGVSFSHISSPIQHTLSLFPKTFVRRSLCAPRQRLLRTPLPSLPSYIGRTPVGCIEYSKSLSRVWHSRVLTSCGSWQSVLEGRQSRREILG